MGIPVHLVYTKSDVTDNRLEEIIMCILLYCGHASLKKRVYIF